MDKAIKDSAKKPYTPPQLTVFGTVRELTQMNGTIRMPDGGPKPNSHTGVK